MNNFGFYVSGNASTLKRFLRYIDNELIVNQIKIVVSDNPNDLELTKILKNLGIPILHFDLSKYNKSEKNIALSNFILETFEKLSVNFGFVFGGRILKGNLLNIYKNKLINFHPAILPSFKGIKAIDQALEVNAFLLGNSAHIVIDDVDSGAIIMQNILHNSKFLDYSDVLNNQIIMLHQIILWLNENRLIISKNSAIIRDAKYEIKDYIPNLELS